MKLHESAEQVLQMLSDPGTLAIADGPQVADDPIGWVEPRPYVEMLKEARRKTGLRCAIAWSRASIDRRAVLLAVSDWRFIGASLGVAEAAALAECFRTGAREKIPVVWVARGGGARWLEGTFSLAAVARILAARNELAASGVPQITVAADPLMAGCTICAMQADVILGMEGARVGFAGSQVVQQFEKDPLPEDFQTAEYALATGQIDVVLRPEDLRSSLSLLLGILAERQPGQATAKAPSDATIREDADAWALAQRARSDDRPATRDVIAQVFDAFFELRGDRVSGDDPAVVTGVARLAGRAVVVIGHDMVRAPEEKVRHNFAMVHPAGHRKALRIVRLAEQLGLPIVTLVDTPGACPDVRSESQGQAGIMGQLLCQLLAATVPTCSVILGQGNSGGAMVLATADRVWMSDSAYYAALSPEGAAAIAWKDAGKAAEAAAALKLAPQDLLGFGLVDGVLGCGPAGRDSGMRVREAVARWLGQADGQSKRVRLRD